MAIFSTDCLFFTHFAEVPFLKLIILIHHKSFDNSVRILFLLFRLVSAKVSPENGSADLAAIMESLLTPASNNRMIVTLLDYIYTLAKIGINSIDSVGSVIYICLFIDQFVEKCHPVEGFTFPPLDSLQRYNCHYENGFRRLIPANAATLVDVCYSILAYFASCQDFYSPKSTVRCRTIEILVHITHHGKRVKTGFTFFEFQFPRIRNNRCPPVWITVDSDYTESAGQISRVSSQNMRQWFAQSWPAKVSSGEEIETDCGEWTQSKALSIRTAWHLWAAFAFADFYGKFPPTRSDVSGGCPTSAIRTILASICTLSGRGTLFRCQTRRQQSLWATSKLQPTL